MELTEQDLRMDEFIIPMAKRGVPPSVISERLHLPPAKIHYVIKRARMRGEDIPNFSMKGREQPKRRIPLKADVRRELEPYASARGLTPIELAERILDVVAADKLVSAILDDTTARAAR